MFRWLAVLRLIVLLNAVALNLYRADNFVRPAVGLLAVAGMVAWTGFTSWAYLGPRRAWLLISDLAVTAGLLALTPLAKGEGFNASIPGFWVMGALFAWAIQWHWRGGLAAGIVLSVADLAARDDISQANYGNAFLLMLGGPIVGFLVESLQLMAAERDRALRAEAAEQERTRLARAVHDGVLQVLSLVQRRGGELGPDGAELGRLAGEQERALRAIIAAQDSVTAGPNDQVIDLCIDLAALGARAGVSISTPGRAVALPRRTAKELVAAVSACLDNTEAHVGHGTPAWVLVEDLGDRVTVTVRDDGPGIPEGRLVEAAAAGRLGISQSIRGRLADLGGQAVLRSGHDGTEWELVVPREPYR